MKLKSYAKINLFLEIRGRRKDGYHNLVSFMQEISLYDDIEVINRKDSNIKVSGDGIKIPYDERNLAWRAAKKMQEASGKKNGVNIHIKKRIPIGAGLGGGSSNAASVLLGLNKLWNTGFSLKKLARIGKTLGADVPFFIYGGACLVRGIGEKVRQLKNIPKINMVLVYPAIHVVTKKVYESYSFKLTKKFKKCSIEHYYNSRGSSLSLKKGLFNRLEESCFKLYPKIQRLKEYLMSYQVGGVLMSGSGSSVFAIVNNAKQARAIKKDIENTRNTVLIVETKGRRSKNNGDHRS
ncbi:MAG: 4-(cytidine 5'-diphospho)-2-C-methyl-D-erythritol kinase [Elusimicrobiota bacterium]